MPILSSVPSRTTRSLDLQRSVESLEFWPPWRTGIVRLHRERESMCSLLHSDNSYGTFRWLETLAPLLGEGGQSFAETAGVGAGDRASFAGARLQTVLSAVRKAREPTAYTLGNLRRSSPNTRRSPKRSTSELCGCHGSDPIQTEKTNSA
jgi:hypothetical protein